MTLGEKIKKALKEADVDVDAAAAHAGVSANTFYRWMRGDNDPSIEKLQLVAEITSKPMWWFFIEGQVISQRTAGGEALPMAAPRAALILIVDGEEVSRITLTPESRVEVMLLKD